MNAKNSHDDRKAMENSLIPARMCEGRGADSDWLPAVDVFDTGQEYLFEFDLPGVKREEIHMSVDGDTLYLCGLRSTLRNAGRSLRVERPSGPIARRLMLPENRRTEGIYGTLQDGVLRLHVPKWAPEEQGVTSPSVRIHTANTARPF
jgi:HSP20 family protein